MAHSSKKSNKSSMTADAAGYLLEIFSIYQEWEKRPLNRNCTGLSECCQFGKTGKTPYLTKGEAMIAQQGWREAGRKEVKLPADGSCPFLKNAKCQIYRHRPFACRTHFCEAAGGMAPRALARDLIQRLDEIDSLLGGNGATNLLSAVTRT